MSELELILRDMIKTAQIGLEQASTYGNDAPPLTNALYNVQAWLKDALAITITADIARTGDRKSYQYGYSNLYKQDRGALHHDD